MALVNVTNVVVLDNPTAFTNPLTFEVTFECLQELDAGELPFDIVCYVCILSCACSTVLSTSPKMFELAGDSSPTGDYCDR